MKMSLIALVATFTVLVSTAIAQENADQRTNQAPELANSPATAANPLADTPESQDGRTMFSGFMDPFDYDQRGRRDPFVMPVPDRPVDQQNVHGPLLPLQKYDLGQLRLVGIIWDVKRPKAMIKDPTGMTHVVGANTKVGPRNGYIAVIREGEMVVVETTEQEGKLVSSAQVVKIAR